MNAMHTIDTVVIGAGHAGLAVSRLLTGAGRDHVVLDRGRVGERWRTERWDSLHLLTPNWMTRLPGWCYGGPDPDGYRRAGDFVEPPGAVRRVVRRPGRGRHDVTRPDHRARRRLPGRHRPRHLARPPRRHRDRSARDAARARGPGRPTCGARPPTATATPASWPPEACSSSEPRRPGCRSPTSSAGPVARSSSRSGGTPGCPAATAAWTSSGGWRAPAVSPAPSTRSPTPRRPARAVAAARRAQRPDEVDARPRPGRAPAPRGPAGRAAREWTAARPVSATS